MLIVGGSGGIGSAIAAACAQRGAWPLVGYCHRPEAAEQVVRSLERGETRRIDLTAPDFDDLSVPDVDMLIHCGGCITAQRRLIDSPPHEVDHLLAVNALGPLRLSRTLLQRSNRRDFVKVSAGSIW